MDLNVLSYICFYIVTGLIVYTFSSGWHAIMTDILDDEPLAMISPIIFLLNILLWPVNLILTIFGIFLSVSRRRS